MCKTNLCYFPFQPPLPPAGALQGRQGSHTSSQRAPPPPPPPDQYGAHRDRSGEPPEKRGRYDQAGGSALDFIKQEYSTGEAEAQEQERKAEAIFQTAGFGAEQFTGLPGQPTSTQLQEQFAGRGLIAVGSQHFLGHLQPGQGLLGEYGSQQNEQLAAIAYGAQTAFVGGFNPPVGLVKTEPAEQQSPAVTAWQGLGRVPVQVQGGFDSNKRGGTPDNRSQQQQQNQPRPNFNQDQNRNLSQGNRPGSGFGGPRNATPPNSRPNQNQPPFQQRNASPGVAGNRNQNFGGQQNRFMGGNSGFSNSGDRQNNYNQDVGGSQESQDDKQIKRERRRPSKWDNPDDKESENAVPENGQEDFQNALSNLRSKIANQEPGAVGQGDKPEQNHDENGGGNQGGFNPGGPPAKGGPGVPGMMGPGPGVPGAPGQGLAGPGGQGGGPGPGGPGGPSGPSGPGPGGPGGPGPRGMGPRGMNPRGPPPGNFSGPPPFGQPGPPRGPRGPGPGMDGPPFGARGRGGFQERGPPPPGNRGPPPRPFGPRGDGDGPRGPPGGGPGGWNPRPGGPPGPPRGFNPRMGGPPGGPPPRGPFPPGPPGRFNRPPPMGQRWQRPPH